MNKIEQTNKSKQKVALGLNIAIIVFIFFGFTFMFAKLYPKGVFSQYGLINLKFYSMIINIFALAMSIVMVVYLTQLKKKKIQEIPKLVYLFDFIVCCGLTTNIVMLLVYLLPVCCITQSYNPEWLFTGTNMIFYLIVPLLFGCEFIFALDKLKISFKQTWLGISIPVLYFVVYSIVCLCNIQSNGTINPTFDFYGFGHFNAGFIALAILALVGISYGCSWLMWYANKKAWINRIIIDLSLNVCILFMCIVVLVWLFWYPIHGETISVGEFVARKFLYFTNWSIFILTVATIINIVFIVLQFTHKKESTPDWVKIVLLSAVSLCAIVLFFELFIAAPVIFVKEGIDRAWRLCFGHQLMLEHLMIPLVAIFTYIVVEHNNLKSRWIWVGAIPLGLYSLIYMIVLYANINNEWSKGVIWDVYSVLKYLNYKVIWLAPCIMYFINVFFTWIVWLANDKIHRSLKNEKQIQVKK